MTGIDIDGHKYQVPETYAEVPLKKFLKMWEYSEKNEPDYSDKPTEEREQNMLKFILSFVSLFTDIPEDKLKRVKVSTDRKDEWGITQLYFLLSRFLKVPDQKEITILPEIKCYGKRYIASPEAVDALGEAKPMAEAKWIEYEEASAALSAMAKLKEGQAKMLPLLAAIIYRPIKSKGWKFWQPNTIEEYSEAEAKWRAFDFERGLNMEQVWSAYFFLPVFRIMLLSDTTRFLKRAEVKGAILNRLDGIRQKNRLRKKAFLARKAKHPSNR